MLEIICENLEAIQQIQENEENELLAELFPDLVQVKNGKEKKMEIKFKESNVIRAKNIVAKLPSLLARLHKDSELGFFKRILTLITEKKKRIIAGMNYLNKLLHDDDSKFPEATLTNTLVEVEITQI